MPEMYSGKFPSIQNIKIDISSVETLLKKLETKKASGPDNKSNIVLKECSKEIAPLITHSFPTQSRRGCATRRLEEREYQSNFQERRSSFCSELSTSFVNLCLL